MNETKDNKVLYKVAFLIADIAHRGQFRNDGVTPYIEHPIAVADMFECWLDKAIAILHDVVEDCDYTIEDVCLEIHNRLRDRDIDPADYFNEISYILGGVRAMTFDNKIFANKFEYLKNIVKQGYTKIKVADITVNLSDDPTDHQKKKYPKYMSILIGGEGLKL